jgi:uncharacterized membrane protein
MQSQQFEYQYQPQPEHSYRPNTYTNYPPQASYPEPVYIERPYNEQASVSLQQAVYQPVQPQFVAPQPSADIDGRLMATASYSLGWLSGLVCLLFSRNRFVRFHALQSVLFFGAITLLDFLWLVTLPMSRWFHFLPSSMMVLSTLVFLLAFLLINFIAFIGWIIAMVQAFRGSDYRMPVVGSIAAGLFPPVSNLKP